MIEYGGQSVVIPIPAPHTLSPNPRPQAALAGARDIIAEWTSELAAAREEGRQAIRRHGTLTSTLSKAAKAAAKGGEVVPVKDKGKGKAGKGDSSSMHGSALKKDADTYRDYHAFR